MCCGIDNYLGLPLSDFTRSSGASRLKSWRTDRNPRPGSWHSVRPTPRWSRLRLCPNSAAPSQDHVPPNALYLTDAFPDAYLAKAARLVQRDAGGVFGENAALQGPHTKAFRFYNQCSQQCLAHALAPTAPRTRSPRPRPRRCSAPKQG